MNGIRKQLHDAVEATNLVGLPPMALEARVSRVFSDMELDEEQLMRELALISLPAGITPTTLIPLFKEWRECVESDVIQHLIAPPPEAMMDSGMDGGEAELERAWGDEQAHCVHAVHDAGWQNGAA